MFALDEDFLARVGLADLPEAERQGLLQHIYEELELRVGTRLSDGMSDAQLEEFEAIIDQDYLRITTWLDANAPDFLDDPLYRGMSKELADKTDAEIVCEYAATKWLHLNRPNHKDTVAAVLDEIADEIRDNAQRILGGNGEAAQEASPAPLAGSPTQPGAIS